MKLLELVKKYTFKDIKKRLFELYPSQESSKKGYEKAWSEIQKKRPRKTQDHYVILIERIKQEEDSYWRVTGKREGDDQDYALEYSTFSEWLSWDVSDEVIKKLGEVECICHILYEMTWNGYTTKDIIRAKELLSKRLKEAKKMYYGKSKSSIRRK